jgi:hypothetical protein
VIPHNSWSTSFWRTYNRETRKKTVSYIKDVFDTAILMLKRGDIDVNLLKDDITLALLGFHHLKGTYKGDFETVGLISTFIDDINKKLGDIVLNLNTKKINVTYKDDLNFFDLIANRQYDDIKKYLYEGHDPNILNFEGKNALHFVCHKLYYDPNILNLLYSFNVDPLREDIFGNTPLQEAVNSGCAEAVIFLETIIGKKKVNTGV